MELSSFKSVGSNHGFCEWWAESLVFSDTLGRTDGFDFGFKVLRLWWTEQQYSSEFKVRLLPVMLYTMLYYLGLNPTLTASWN